MKKHNKAKALLNKSNESFYWLGYLASDGSFQPDSGGTVSRISFKVNDLESIEAFKSFLNVDNKIGLYNNKTYTINVMDTNTCKELKKLYNINSRKTYNPMKVRLNNEDNFISYLIGFIDGDGSIKLQTKRKTAKVNIKCHSSWLPEFKYWHRQLELCSGEIIAGPKINNQGYCSWNIANLIVIKYLKLKSRKLKLPILKRKWNIIDLRITNSSNIRELYRRYLRKKIPFLKNKGIKNKEIMRQLNITEGRIYYYKEYFNV